MITYVHALCLPADVLEDNEHVVPISVRIQAVLPSVPFIGMKIQATLGAEYWPIDDVMYSAPLDTLDVFIKDEIELLPLDRMLAEGWEIEEEGAA
ncbi:hypothetical protein [Chitinimonas naiadis]